MKQNTINDPRIDPRLRTFLAQIPPTPTTQFENRDAVLREFSSEQGQARLQMMEAFMNSLDSEEIAPREGLKFETLEFRSSPDNNIVKLSFIRPNTNEILPCVYYIHGGGMMAGSCFFGVYQAWARSIARNDVAVALVDFRNCAAPSSSAEIAPFPAGLNDCFSGVFWLHENASTLGIDRNRIVVAGESGGANLTLATALKLNREGKINKIAGLYALAPYIAGHWPQDRFPSSSENNGILLNVDSNMGAMAYGIEALNNEDPLAWPMFAKHEDVKGFPQTSIIVNEFDPLRDEGIAFYHLLLDAGVAVCCHMSLGTIHASELLSTLCPDISTAAANNLAHFARSASLAPQSPS